MIVPAIDTDDLEQLGEDELTERIAAEAGYTPEAARVVAQVMLGTYTGPPLT